MKLTIYTDGGARGNPGPAGIGVYITEKGKKIKEISEYIGKATNNQAEYKALIRGLEEAKKLKADEVNVVMDSELIVKQMNQEYKVKDKNLASLFVRAWNLINEFQSYTVKHVVRSKNKKADDLVNHAIDKEVK
ncbi:ribonuclease H [bacterium]|jgi:ribonuclease HI|nr:ribonuclease H [bacterium]MDP6571357.1 ribonuclease HI family protein [Patescibacteria group bacterium]MDP6756370.1 ribonuclease HI family protein [Patescibacteria group bacterium]|tara:strand:- start:1139 stop:1540 length:402 start_codon:yes stop_codon:yes gene_type:complete